MFFLLGFKNMFVSSNERPEGVQVIETKVRMLDWCFLPTNYCDKENKHVVYKGARLMLEKVSEEALPKTEVHFNQENLIAGFTTGFSRSSLQIV